MINGFHAILYSEDAEADRAFFRDVLKFGHIDAGEGWLIFAMPPTESGIHPADGHAAGMAGKHEVYLMCDDIHATMKEPQGRGAKFKGEPSDQGWGVVAAIVLPGGSELGIYQPRHPRP